MSASYNYLVISSKDKDTQTDDASKCRIRFAEFIEGRYQLKAIQMTNTIYNIDASNNKVYFYENVTAKVATLSAGSYSASTLATEAATQMTTTSGGYNTYTVTYDNTTKKLAFSASNAFYFNWAADSGYGAWQQLGFNYLTNTNAATSVVAPNVINLSVSSVLVSLDKCADDRIMTVSNSARGNVFLPLSQGYGGVEQMIFDTYTTYLTFERTNQISIRITDLKGNTRSLNGGQVDLFLIKCGDYHK